MNTVQIGDISEARILIRFMELRIPVLLPWNNGLRYDMIIELDGKFKRIQIKTGQFKDGIVSFVPASLDSTTRNSQIPYYGQIDYFAVYCPQNNGYYLIPVDHAPSNRCHMRVEPPKNNQMKNIRWARDYELDDRYALSETSPELFSGMNTVQIGDISEAKILARFIELEYAVMLPWSHGLRYDMVIEKEGIFKRIQVKTAQLVDDALIRFNASNHNTKADREKWQRQYYGEIDYFAVYCPQLDKTYWIHVDDAPGDHCHLRLKPAANNQTKGVRWARDYEL